MAAVDEGPITEGAIAEGRGATTEDPGARVPLPGRLDASTVSAIRATVHQSLDRGTGPLVLDLSSVHTIDATGLGMLIGVQRRATEAGRFIVLQGVPARVARLLRATRLDRVLLPEPAAATGLV